MVLNPHIEIAMKKNCWTSILLIVFAFSLLLFALPAVAQESTLQVKCIDSSGAPAAGVKVFAVNMKNPQKPKDKKSDAQGVAEFTKLEDGAYRVIGRKDGLVPALYEFAVLKGSSKTVTLKFEAGADKKLYFEDPAEEQKAAALLKQGLDAAQQKKFPEAEKSINDALAIKPSMAEGLYYLGQVFLQQEKYDQALEVMDRAAEAANAWIAAGAQGPYPQIVQSAQQTRKKLPAIKGENALKQKNYDAAAKAFNEAIQSDPNDPEFRANLAIALANATKYDEALAAIDQAIKLKSTETAYAEIRKTIAAKKENAVIDKAQSVLNEGNALLQNGDAAGALKKFEEAKGMIATDRQSPIWRQIGRAQAKLNQPEALESFKKAIELAPKDKVTEYKNSLAQYYLDSKQYDLAVDTVLEAGDGGEGQEKTLLSMAKTRKDKEPKLAIAALERVLKLSPDNLDTTFDLAQLYYSEGKENDKRTKELLAKYSEKGQDAGKLDSVKGMLVIINRRTK
jgi:tetratricopeptide (TPR) repeat protein